MKLYIKYMVSTRCKIAVKEELKKMGLHFIVIDLGEIEILEELDSAQRAELKAGLGRSGLVLMEDKKADLVVRIKAIILEMIHHTNDLTKIKFSDFLAHKLGLDYTYMANLFSEVQGSTIAQYIIAQKIARIKELINNDELSITEIAYRMNYSSVGHLSNQFKKMTGLSPSEFRQLKDKSLSAMSLSGEGKEEDNDQ